MFKTPTTTPVLLLVVVALLLSHSQIICGQRLVLQVNTTADHPMFYTGYSSADSDQSFQSIGLRTFPLKESALSMFVQKSFKEARCVLMGATNFVAPNLYTF